MAFQKSDSDLIFGLNPIKNALIGKRKPQRILISKNRPDREVIGLAASAQVPYELVEPALLDRLTHNRNHQGFVGYLAPFEYASLDSLLLEKKEAKESLLLVLDGVEDPNNFGSLIRTASCFGLDGVIIGKDRQVQVTGTVSKVATGAEQFVPICQVPNVASSLEKLKKYGYWIVASDGSGTVDYDQIDYCGKMAIVVGGEGRGVSQLVLKRSDFVARIPIAGPITSLNAAVAGAVLIAAAVSLRKMQK